MGLLVNPASANAEVQLASVPVAAKALGLQVVVQSASRDRDLETAFVTFVQQRIDALVLRPTHSSTDSVNNLSPLPRATRYP